MAAMKDFWSAAILVRDAGLAHMKNGVEGSVYLNELGAAVEELTYAIHNADRVRTFGWLAALADLLLAGK